ncbi:IS605 OrfB family transposase [Anaeroplasma bactoclasticum]|uniref:IS605 OrfB family transposase n=1 Tax=Anaeroplasma bactoclasticum TaxID=2088 RepID=A0A397RMZ6_9MOLU|nr:IS200/IS605 family accessory protein TnpB-related protein [Anaeroplasma bactoclasticum]RIA75710.1 IS605 OrfB family transposase [Anaeroplasma bactoclasticum]
MAVVSYNVEVINNTNKLRHIVANTLSLYNSALNYVCDVVLMHYDEIKELNNLERRMYLEHLIHNTKNNIAKYDFDSMYYKLPCYLLRDIESKAIGHIVSYKSNLDNYKKERYNKISNGKKFKKREPSLSKCNMLPSFYKDNMYKVISDNKIALKIYEDNTWKYEEFKLKKNDLKYINKINGKRYNPEIKIIGKKIYIKFSFEIEDVKLQDKELNKRIICGVDLGVNNDATISIMNYEGTILGRHFINTNNKDLMNHLLNKKRKIQRNSGNYKYLRNLHINNKINSINENIVNHTVNQIIKICLSYGVDVIVFENLRHKFKRAKRSFRARLHRWRKIAIYNKAYEMAHRNGIRVSTVNPNGTSRYAYDGSGEVERDNDNYSICKFVSGKIYNCDLSASYNIAARYYIRETLKPLDESSRSKLETKASLALSGTKLTYNTFKVLLNVIN